MVCPRCVMAVKDLLKRQGLTAIGVTLGMAQIQEDLTECQLVSLRDELVDLGFGLIDDPQNQLVEQIRLAVIDWVRTDGEREKCSIFLQRCLARDYSLLSKLFSEVRGMTIERYCILQRIEYAKELLCYSELTIAEVAFKIGYSSPAHMSTQFRQETGMSPSVFKKLNSHNALSSRKCLDEI